MQSSCCGLPLAFTNLSTTTLIEPGGGGGSVTVAPRTPPTPLRALPSVKPSSGTARAAHTELRSAEGCASVGAGE